MIFRPALGAHICLRCQLRLSRSGPNDASFQAPAQIPRGIRGQHDEVEAKSSAVPRTWTQSRSHRPAEGDLPPRGAPPSRRDPRSRHEEGPGWRHLRLRQSQLSAHPLGRLHGPNKYKLREKVEHLDVQSLGEPAEVIVLRDAAIRFATQAPSIADEESETVDILARLNDERGLVGQAEVERNIEELRPSSGKLIHWDDFQVLEDKLNRGFTSSQISRYIESFNRRSLSDLREIEKPAWMPGISEGSENFEESSLRGYLSEALTPKQCLVVQLLRQCWQVEIQEISESLGEVEIKVKGVEFELLVNNRGTQSPLKIITDKLIKSHEEKIEAFRSRSVIRITATRDKAHLMVEEIQSLLQNVHHLEVDLQALLPKSKSSKSQIDDTVEYGEAVIDELARITNVEIQRQPHNKLFIACINRKPDTKLSTPADISRRLLLTSSDTVDRIIKQLAYKKTAELIFALKFEATPGMSWRERLQQWVRWTAPSSKSKGKQNENMDHALSLTGNSSVSFDETKVKWLRASKHRVSKNDLEMSSKEHGQIEVKKPDFDSFDASLWSNEHVTESSVVVGHILHRQSDATASLAYPYKATMDWDKSFVPTVLNISRFMSMTGESVHLSEASLMMRFLPSPWSTRGQVHPNTFPPVELQFAIDPDTESPSLVQVKAILDHAATDMMLPDRALDLRFEQVTSTSLHMDHLLQLPQITRFLEHSQLDLKGGSLATPPGLTIPISKRLFSQEFKQSSASESAPIATEVDYLFAGLEYRNTISLNFRGWRLDYNSIEAGKADGRRVELRLSPRLQSGAQEARGIQSKDNESRWQEMKTRQFINAAHCLVNALENPESVMTALKDSLSPDKQKSEKGDTFKSVQYFKKDVNFVEDLRPSKEMEKEDVESSSSSSL